MKTALTVYDFDNIYDQYHGGRKARTLSMETVFQWVKSSPYVEYDAVKDEFYKKEGIIS